MYTISLENTISAISIKSIDQINNKYDQLVEETVNYFFNSILFIHYKSESLPLKMFRLNQINSKQNDNININIETYSNSINENAKTFKTMFQLSIENLISYRLAFGKQLKIFELMPKAYKQESVDDNTIYEECCREQFIRMTMYLVMWHASKRFNDYKIQTKNELLDSVNNSIISADEYKKYVSELDNMKYGMHFHGGEYGEEKQNDTKYN